MAKAIKAAGFIPTSRIEALTDAVFAFAMTLLVINIELPQDFHPKTDQEFLRALAGLSDTFIAYLITFLILVSYWIHSIGPPTCRTVTAWMPGRLVCATASLLEREVSGHDE